MATPRHITVQEVIADTCAVLQKINIVLNDHEQRLHTVEGFDVRVEFKLLRQRIALISDEKKQVEALQTFKELCNSLGIQILSHSVGEIFWV